MQRSPSCWRQSNLVAAVVIPSMVIINGHSIDGGALENHAQDDDATLTLRASPRVAFAPASILFVGQVRGGPDDNEELYCASIEWDWGDDTRSESTPDCEPYESGTSEIRRRFSVRHTYDYGGRYEVRLHLKQRADTIISARTNVQVRGSRFP